VVTVLPFKSHSFTIGANGSNETDIKLVVTGTQKISHVNGFDVKPSSTNELDVKSWVTALTASVVAQFAISAIFTALFSNEIIVHLLKYAPHSHVGAPTELVTPSTRSEDKKIEDAKWGYKVGLVVFIPGFITLIITMIVIGLTGSLIR
jgi:hypothetical protein